MFEYEAALHLDPGQPTIHNNLGACLAGKRRWDDSIAHYREALRLRPGYAEAARNLRVAEIARTSDGR